MSDTRPHDHGERWDQSDREALARYVAEGFTSRAISYAMGRTLDAVRAARRRHLPR